MHITNNPLVSLYILCYNHEKYIEQAIESVLNQTYKNIELIVVDNASADSSVEKIMHYLDKDSRIKFFQLEYNTYPSAGSNYAIKQCSGEYICGLAADDYFILNKVEKQLEIMLSNNYSNSFTWVETVNDKGESLPNHWTSKLFNRNFEKHALQKVFIQEGNTLCAITWMMHKTIFEKYGMFDHRLLQTQDFELWCKIIQHEELNVIPEKLTCYRVRDDGNNLSVTLSSEQLLRASFEPLYYIPHILNFDNKIFSQALGLECNDENKYRYLFDFYKRGNKIPEALAVLLTLYNQLERNFKFPSDLYKDFLKIYSSFDVFGILEGRTVTKFLQIFFDTGSGYNELKSEKEYLKNTCYLHRSFSFSRNGNLTNIRLDPLNDSCIVEIKSIALIDNYKKQFFIKPSFSNAAIQEGMVFYFDTQDPQIYFDFSKIDLSAFCAIELSIEFMEQGSKAVSKIVEKLKLENYNSQFYVRSKKLIKRLFFLK